MNFLQTCSLFPQTNTISIYGITITLLLSLLNQGRIYPHLQGEVQAFNGVVHEGALLPTLLCNCNATISNYLRWPNLHVRRSVAYYLLFIKFISALYHVCVTGQLHSTVNLPVKVLYILKIWLYILKIWLHNNLDMFTYLTMIFN